MASSIDKNIPLMKPTFFSKNDPNNPKYRPEDSEGDSQNTEYYFGTNHICRTCGTEFYVPAWMRQGYRYKSGKDWFCSYSCHQKQQTKKKPKRYRVASAKDEY